MPLSHLTIELTEQLLQVLKGLKTHVPERDYGICYNLGLLRLDAILPFIDIKPFIKTWPDKRGNNAYPVEGSCEEYALNSRKWDKNTLYGKRRYQLLDWLITQVENELLAKELKE